jgi:hypothetical protein
MVKVTIEDDCYAPRKTTWVEYSGPDPFAFVREGRNLLRPIFEVGTSRCGEPRWMWDWSGDPIQLYLHWYVKKRYSRFSEAHFSIRTVGFKAKARNEGTFRMEIEPVLRHEIKGNRLVIFIWWIYWYLFYNRIRQSMIARCKAMADKFVAVIKEMYHLGATGEE